MSYNFSTAAVRFLDSADWDYGTGNFTFYSRVKLTATAGNQMFIDSQGAGAGTGVRYLNAGGTNIQVNINGGADITYAWTPNALQWYVILLIRSGTTLSVYLDGTKIGTDASNNSNVTGSGNALAIGASSPSGGNEINGMISEVAIWKGVALTQSEINNLTNSHLKYMPLQIQPLSLVLYATLDDFPNGVAASGSGSIIDRSSKQKKGTPAGTLTGRPEEVLTYP